MSSLPGFVHDDLAAWRPDRFEPGRRSPRPTRWIFGLQAVGAYVLWAHRRRRDRPRSWRCASRATSTSRSGGARLRVVDAVHRDSSTHRRSCSRWSSSGSRSSESASSDRSRGSAGSLSAVLLPIVIFFTILVRILAWAGVVSLGMTAGAIACEKKGTWDSVAKAFNYLFARPLRCSSTSCCSYVLRQDRRRACCSTAATCATTSSNLLVPLWDNDTYEKIARGATSELAGVREGRRLPARRRLLGHRRSDLGRDPVLDRRRVHRDVPDLPQGGRRHRLHGHS